MPVYARYAPHARMPETARCAPYAYMPETARYTPYAYMSVMPVMHHRRDALCGIRGLPVDLGAVARDEGEITANGPFERGRLMTSALKARMPVKAR